MEFRPHSRFHEVMAPKQSKPVSSAAASSGGYADTSAQPPENTANDHAIASLLQAMEDMTLDDVSKDDMLKVADGLKSMKKRWSEIEKSKNKKSPEEKLALKKEKDQFKKMEKKKMRESMATFIVRLGSMEVEVRVPLSITAGALRRKVADMLNLGSKAAKTLTLMLEGVNLTSAPRKTLFGGFNVRGGGIIMASVYGLSNWTSGPATFPPQDEDENDDDDGSENEDEEETESSDSEMAVEPKENERELPFTHSLTSLI